MVRARANGIELEYEEIGEGPPMLLVMGIGAQLVYWPDGFCERLAARNYRVIRFDNRDVGLSTKLEGAGVPRVFRLMARALAGLKVAAPYTLDDMAGDTVGLLDALGIDRAHVVGVSMGGMIAQTMALRHPKRMLSLTSIASNTGDRRHMLLDPRAARVLLGKPPKSREQAMDRAEAFYRAVGSRGFALDIAALRSRAARAFERCLYPPGFARQMAAVLASGSRTKVLGKVRVPTLVIHGSDDTMLRPSGGRATARAIPGARFVLIEGMGHDLPEGAWSLLIDAIDAHARNAR
jgi:pimeloyl-ACP methyl ester carboxylesterase